jgi:hypothetical protein
MTLEASVLEILGSFKKGDYFDSHTVINTLLANSDYHLAYLCGYSKNDSVAQYHGKIAELIGKSGLANKIGIAKSHTIYGDLSDNKLWQKN